MTADRPHDDVVGELLGMQAALRSEPVGEPDAVSVIDDDLTVRVAGITERVQELERTLAGLSARLDQEIPSRVRVMEWRRLPEFNLCPPMLQMTLDDTIALLQVEVAERTRRES